MDIVALTSSIGGIEIVAEHRKELSPSDADLGDEGHEVVRNATGIFPYPPARMRADRIEVPLWGTNPTLAAAGLRRHGGLAMWSTV